MSVDATPKVSVILPVISSASTLARAIVSVLRQNVAQLELIIVNAEVAADEAAITRAVAGDARVRHLRSPTQLPADVCDTARRAAKGQWLAYLRDGDEWLLDRLNRQLTLADQLGSDCLMIAGRLLEYVPPGKSRLHKWAIQADGNWLDPRQSIKNGPDLMRTALVRRSLLEKLTPFDPSDVSPKNFAWCLQLLKNRQIATVAYGVVVAHARAADSATHLSLRNS